jgi:hypothetical protein
MGRFETGSVFKQGILRDALWRKNSLGVKGIVDRSTGRYLQPAPGLSQSSHHHFQAQILHNVVEKY